MKAAIWKSSRMLAVCVRAVFGVLASAFSPVISGADCARGRNVVHHDIKPANITHKPDHGNLKLTDSRLARVTDSSKTKTGTVAGTPSYMPPAEASAKKVNGCSGLLSLGVTLYQLCTGRLLIVSDSWVTPLTAIANDPQSSPHSIMLDLPAQLIAVIDEALANFPANRLPRGAKFVRTPAQGAPLTASA